MKSNLRKIREKNNLSQTDIAKLLDVTRQAVSLYEQGKRQLNTTDINTLSSYFKVSEEYLLGAYSKEEIGSIVQKHFQENIDKKQRTLLSVFQPVTNHTVENYLIAMGVIPFDIPKDENLLTEKQINDPHFWMDNLKPLYNDVAMKWLITKPDLTATKDDVLNAVNSAMTTIINASTTSYNKEDVFNYNYEMDAVVKNHYLQRRIDFLERFKYWDNVEILKDHYEEYPVFDFKHPHELDGKHHTVAEIK